VIIKLFDRTDIVVTKHVADKLRESLLKSPEGMVTISDYMIKKSAIAYIKPGGYTQADIPQQTDAKRLQADNRSEDEQYQSARKKAEKIRKDLYKKMSVSK
jgi:hypothetical protein